MKIIISLVIGIAIWFMMTSLTHTITRSIGLAWTFGILFGLIAIYISFKKLHGISVRAMALFLIYSDIILLES